MRFQYNLYYVIFVMIVSICNCKTHHMSKQNICRSNNRHLGHNNKTRHETQKRKSTKVRVLQSNLLLGQSNIQVKYKENWSISRERRERETDYLWTGSQNFLREVIALVMQHSFRVLSNIKWMTKYAFIYLVFDLNTVSDR